MSELLSCLAVGGSLGHVSGPEVWILGSSPSSASVAAALGLSYCYAHFINPGGATAALSSYRAAFRSRFGGRCGPRAMCAVLGVCAASSEEGAFHAASTWRWGYEQRRGATGPVPRPEVVLADAESRRQHQSILATDPRLFVDDPPGWPLVSREFGAAVGADELMVATIVADPRVRRSSYELLAVAWEDGASDTQRGSKSH